MLLLDTINSRLVLTLNQVKLTLLSFLLDNVLSNQVLVTIKINFRLEAVDCQGKIVWSFETSASSPKYGDEQLCWRMKEWEIANQIVGGFVTMLTGTPQHMVVHFFDRGFR